MKKDVVIEAPSHARDTRVYKRYTSLTFKTSDLTRHSFVVVFLFSAIHQIGRLVKIYICDMHLQY